MLLLLLCLLLLLTSLQAMLSNPVAILAVLTWCPCEAAGRVVRAVASLWLLPWTRLWLLLLLVNCLPSCKSELLLSSLTTCLTSSSSLLLTKTTSKAPSVKGAVLAQRRRRAGRGSGEVLRAAIKLAPLLHEWVSRSKVLDLATSTHQLAQAEAGLPLWPLHTTLPTRALLHWGRSECNWSHQPGIAGEVGDAPDGSYVWRRLAGTPCLRRHERWGGRCGQGD